MDNVFRGVRDPDWNIAEKARVTYRLYEDKLKQMTTEPDVTYYWRKYPSIMEYLLVGPVGNR